MARVRRAQQAHGQRAAGEGRVVVLMRPLSSSAPPHHALAAATGAHRRSVYHFVEPDYMRVVEQLQDLDLASNLLVHLQLPDPVAVQDLHSHLVSRKLVLGDCGRGHTRWLEKEDE
jgi:hypothetical protein